MTGATAPPYAGMRLPRSRGARAARLLCVACAFSLCGCIIVPIAPLTHAPYADTVLERLSQQGADRALVQRMLGSPTFSKAGNKYWFYGNQRPSFVALSPAGGMGFSLKEWMAVAFSGTGRVSFVERSKDVQGCLSNGLCLLTDIYTFAVKDGRDVVVTAPLSDDVAAKALVPSPTECALYLFVDAHGVWFQVHSRAHFAIDGKRVTDLEQQTYLVFRHAAGRFTVTADYIAGDRRTLAAECAGGASVYVRATKSSGLTVEVTDLDLADAQQGAHEIAVRRLALE